MTDAVPAAGERDFNGGTLTPPRPCPARRLRGPMSASGATPSSGILDISGIAAISSISPPPDGQHHGVRKLAGRRRADHPLQRRRAADLANFSEPGAAKYSVDPDRRASTHQESVVRQQHLGARQLSAVWGAPIYGAPRPRRRSGSRHDTVPDGGRRRRVTNPWRRTDTTSCRAADRSVGIGSIAGIVERDISFPTAFSNNSSPSRRRALAVGSCGQCGIGRFSSAVIFNNSSKILSQPTDAIGN